MPGYPPLPNCVIGPEADRVRQADSRRRGGQLDAAVCLLEEALQACLTLNAELPGWLCGRLAALYRTLGRYDDEVLLLERFRDSQHTQDARSRYDARLSKARTIADRKRRPESVALESVRRSMRRATAQRAPRSVARADAAGTSPFSPFVMERVTRALASTARRAHRNLDVALAHLCDEAHAHAVAPEDLVAALKHAYGALPPSRRLAVGETRYDQALLTLLAQYFKDQAA